jgi:hypothetical protein
VREGTAPGQRYVLRCLPLLSMTNHWCLMLHMYVVLSSGEYVQQQPPGTTGFFKERGCRLGIWLFQSPDEDSCCMLDLVISLIGPPPQLP